jgi:hypothetical protein
MRKRKPLMGKVNKEWRFSYSLLRKAMFIPYNIIFDSLNKGDAIVVSFVQK